MLELRHRLSTATLLVATALSATSQTGCSLVKRSGAQESALASAHKLALQMDPKSNLTRFSGRALQVRLSQLFPAQLGTGNLDIGPFSHEYSTGANQAIAQVNRPVNALEQVALKSNNTFYCGRESVPTSYSAAPQGSIYSDKIWFSNELATLPTDEAVLAAMVVSRNVWLEPLPSDAPEIVELAGLYLAILKTVENGESQTATAKRQRAHQALCIASLSSAQFSLGIPGPRDAMRRMMIEVGSRVPTFVELEAVTHGKKTVLQFLDEMQKDPKSGYYTAINQWHNDWLGLRQFLPNSIWAGTNPDNTVTFDPRGGHPNLTWTPMSLTGAKQYGVTEAEHLAYPRIYPAHDGPSVPYTCDVNQLQTFDPRTTMVVYERNNGTVWQASGAFVHKDRLQDYANILNAYGVNDFSAAADCKLFSEAASPDHRFALEGTQLQDYYRCRGRISTTQGAGLSPGNMSDYRSGGPELRMRRFSPSGEQGGVSVVKTWYAQEPRLVCNSFPRIMFTCAYRPPSFGSFVSPSDYTDFGFPGIGLLSVGTYWSTTSMGHPGVLNQFRCGKSDPASLARIDQPLNEEQGYPWGYDRTNYLGSGLSQLNDTMTLALASFEINNEGAAIKRLRKDLKQEPYRLIDYVVANNRSYKEVFSADYLVGHEELELFYRAQGQALPLYPPGFTPDVTADRTVENPAPVPISRFQGLPSHYVPNNLYGNNYLIRGFPPNAGGIIPPRPKAGVLSMPAFVSPVGGKMRTIASRYFARLLCGDPSVFVPEGAQKRIHVRHMLDVNNPETSRTAAEHINGKSECFTCHVNLDPLGAALSSTFLANVQINEGLGATGEMNYLGVWQGGNWLGAIWSPSKGTGAFLGAEVTGVEGVARQLVSSDLWAKCVVSKTFENVFGRVQTLSDVESSNAWQKKFQTQGYNYNRLVRDMVSSSLYQGAN